MKTDRRGHRPAFILLETIAAGLLVGLVMVMTVRLLTWTAAERRSAERRGWAVQEAANAMELLAGSPFDRLAPGPIASVTLSPGAKAILPEGRIGAEVRDEPDGMKRIDVRVFWKGAAGIDEAPVRLSAWVAKKGANR